MNLFSEPAAQVIVAIIPIVGIVFGGIVIFFYLLWDHRQKMLQIRNGVYNPKQFDVVLFSLLCGLLLTCVGAVLTVFFFIIGGASYMLLGGLIPFAVGVGLLLFNRLHKN